MTTTTTRTPNASFYHDSLAIHLREYNRQLLANTSHVSYLTNSLHHHGMEIASSLNSAFDAMQRARAEYAEARARLNSYNIG